jgi:DNA topoisomerase-1
MEAAEIERTTVDIPSSDMAAWPARHRPGRQVRRLPRRLYQEGKDESDDEDGGRLPAMATGETPKLTEAVHTQHFTEPPPRYLGSLAGQEAGRTRHRPPVDLRLDPVDADRPRLCEARTRSASSRKTRAAGHGIFLEKFFARYVEYDFTAALEEKLDLVSDGKLAWKDFLREFWTEFSPRRSATPRSCASPTCSTRSTSAGPTPLPAAQ